MSDYRSEAWADLSPQEVYNMGWQDGNGRRDRYGAAGKTDPAPPTLLEAEAAPSTVTGEAELPRTFGELVRRDRGAVQAIDAAKVAGVSRSFWSDVEHNRRVPSRIVASKMCGAVVGNWNEWLIAWARERLDGSFDDLRLAIEAEASAEPPRTIDVADAHGTLTGSGTEADPYRTPGELGRGYTRAEALYDLAARLDSQGSQSPDATATGSAQGREE